MVAPHFSMLWSGAIPRRVVTDAEGRTTEVTLIAGQYGDLHAPPPPPRLLGRARPTRTSRSGRIKLAPGARLTLPPAAAGSNRALYFFRGERLRAGGREVPAAHEIVLRPDREIALEAGGDEVELLLLQGRPDRRAGRRLRPVRDEHAGRDSADLRRLPAHAVRRLALAELRAGPPARGGAVRAPRRRAPRAPWLIAVATTTITGFHQDAAGDWVAELACGHAQHVRHRPPWQRAALDGQRGGARGTLGSADRVSAL